MTLRVPTPSRESLAAVQSHLSELAGRIAFRERALGQANPLDIALAAPHDVYTLGLDQLLEAVDLEAAKPVSRRFLVMAGDEAVSSAEITAPDGAGFQANEGPFVAASADAIARAEADPELGARDYEVRLLRIPALYFVALWLKDDRDRNHDVLVPLDPAPAPFEAGRKYRPAEALSALTSMARERIRFDDVGTSVPDSEP
jgi:hypothetical protein